MTEPYTPSVKGAREDLRDWLRRYRTARNRKRDLDNRLKNVLANLNAPPLGGQGSGSPGSGTPSAGAAAIAYKIDEVEQRIKDQQGRMAQIFLETSEVIDLLPDIEDRQLLEKRYIDCQGWQQIEKDLYLARSNLARREAKALDTLLQHKTVQEKLAAWLLACKGLSAADVRAESHAAYKERQYDLLADAVRTAVDIAAVYRAMDACAAK